MGIGVNHTLLSNVGAVGNGGNVNISHGGSYLYTIAGTFGGTSSKLQLRGPDDTTFMDVANTTLTAAGMVKVDLPAGAVVRSVLTGGTPSAMHAKLGLVQSAG